MLVVGLGSVFLAGGSLPHPQPVEEIELETCPASPLEFCHMGGNLEVQEEEWSEIDLS